MTPVGGRLWRFKYRLNGLEKKLALGRYPELSLSAARKTRDAAREMLGAGGDPAAAKRRERIAARMAAGATFGAVSEEYIDKVVREARAPATISKLRWARSWLPPAMGHRPIDQIEPHELLAVLKRQEASGHLETARRTRAFASRVFRYAVVTARAKADPAALLLGAVAAPKPKHLAAIVDPRRVGELLRAIDHYGGQPSTRFALALVPHIFLRPGELRKAEWAEINLDAAVWRVPAIRMKMRREHVVPLSQQAIAILEQAKVLSGHVRFVFPALGKRDRPMSENTITSAIRRMGFAPEEMTAHGFRAMASTLLNESGRWSPDAIERALAHKDTDQVRAAYHRGAHWNERVVMAQWWSDHLDALKNGAEVIPIHWRAWLFAADRQRLSTFVSVSILLACTMMFGSAPPRRVRCSGPLCLLKSPPTPYGRGLTAVLYKRGLSRRLSIDFEGQKSLDDDCQLKAWFWVRETLSRENWDTGDFEVQLNEELDSARAFGVEFLQSDIEAMAPAPPPQPVDADQPTQRGRRPGPLWAPWIVELVAYIHENGVPDGIGSQGQEELLKGVADALAARGAKAPGRSTVQAVVQAVLDRLRSTED